MATYTSQYPTQDGDHVKATTMRVDYHPYHATDPALSLTGSANGTTWNTVAWTITDQRFHVDLGSTKIIRRIYYENYHTSGDYVNAGILNFTFQGSNTEASFLELTYATNTGWTNITTSQGTFDEHVELDQADPKYTTCTNTTAYRYYAFKFADNRGAENYLCVRHMELQTEDGYGEEEDNAIFFGAAF